MCEKLFTVRLIPATRLFYKLHSLEEILNYNNSIKRSLPVFSCGVDYLSIFNRPAFGGFLN